MRSSRYSLNGYINAVARRSSKTIMVEGTTDRDLLSRLIAERAVSSKFPPSIDIPDIIDDTEFSGFGARDKVIAVRNIASSSNSAQPKFGTLVDREWEGLIDDTHCRHIPPAHIDQGPQHFVTVGHSAENYHFNVDCLIAYLRFRLPHYSTPTLESVIRENFPHIIAFASAYSIEAAKRGIMSRAATLLNHNNVIYNSGGFRLGEAFKADFIERHLTDAEGFIESVAALTIDIDRTCNLEWCIHGHLGENAIWAATAVTAANCGLPNYEVSIIAQPTNQERRRFWHDWIAKGQPETRVPLDEVVAWALSS